MDCSILVPHTELRIEIVTADDDSYKFALFANSECIANQKSHRDEVPCLSVIN